MYNMIIMTCPQFIHRTCRQHNSVVVTIPKPVLTAMGMSAKDYLLFEQSAEKDIFTIRKLIPGELRNGQNRENSGQPDKS